MRGSAHKALRPLLGSLLADEPCHDEALLTDTVIQTDKPSDPGGPMAESAFETTMLQSLEQLTTAVHAMADRLERVEHQLDAAHRHGSQTGRVRGARRRNG